MGDPVVSSPDTLVPPESPAPRKRTSSFAADMLKLVSGTVVAQAVALVATPIITRLFSPEAFGVNAAFISISSVAQVFLLLRYDQAIVLPEDDRDASNLLVASILIGIVISLLISVTLWFFGDWILNVLNLGDAAGYLWVLLPTLLISVFYTVLNTWFTRVRNFSLIAAGQMVNALGTTGMRIGAGLIGANGAPALLITNMLGSLVALFYLGRGALNRTSRDLWSAVSWQNMLAQLRRYADQPRYGTVAMLLNTVSWQLPVFLLTGFFSPAIAGQYALGQRVISTPMSLVGNSISQVFFARAAASYHDGSLESLALGVLKRLVIFGLAPTLFLLIEARDLFSIVFGPEWSEAGAYVQILALWSFVWFISSPISQLQIVLERQRFFLYWNLANFLTRFASLWIGSMQDSVELGLLLFGASGVVMYGFLTLYLTKAAGISNSSVFRIIGVNALLYAPALLLAVVMQVTGVDLWVRLATISLLFVLTFVYSVRDESVTQSAMRKLRTMRGGS